MPYRPIRQDEIPTFSNICARAFRFDPARMEKRLTSESHRYGPDQCFLWEDEARGPVAGLVSFERTLALHGAELRASLLASVSVPPDQRRRGYANAMVGASLRQDWEQKRPLSLLYPYSIPFYNRLGYGMVSYQWTMEFPLAQLGDFDEMARTRRLTEADLPAMQRLYERERARHNGWLSRTEWEWRVRVLDLDQEDDWPERSEGVVVPGDDGELLGYLIYAFIPASGSNERMLTLYEWVSDSEDGAAWRALAGFVAAQRAQAAFLHFNAPVGFPLHHALREKQTHRHARPMDFALRDMQVHSTGMMGRLTHLEQALRQRPWPATVQGECVIQMRDPQLPENEAPLHLYLEGGRAAVAPAQHRQRGVTPTAVADVRTWSELYAAALTPRDAHRLGRLEADAPTLAFLTAALDSQPWYVHSSDWF